MSDRSPQPSPQMPFALASGALFIGVLVVAIIFISKANGPGASTAVAPPGSASAAATGTASPPATASSSPTAVTAQVPYADCSTATFGPALQPLNPPANVHVYSAPPAMQIDATKLYRATITTARGAIVLCLQPTLAPNTVNNFVTLARNHFYDGIPFHRVCPNLTDNSCGGTPPLGIAQAGDPNCIGNVHATTCGGGGPGYTFAFEPVRQQYTAGSLGMANPNNPNGNGSQFFIDTTANQFPPNYNLFGNVSSGLDVALAIKQGDVMQSVTVSQQQ